MAQAQSVQREAEEGGVRLLTPAARILLIIESAGDAGIQYVDILERSGHSSSTVNHWLRTLQLMGLIERDERRMYRLTEKGRALLEELRREICG